MANAVDLNDKLAYLVITGASRGIGAKLAVEISRKLRAGSVIVLIARSSEGLAKTSSEILKVNEGVKVLSRSVDLTKPEVHELNNLIKDSYDGDTAFDLAIIVHNIGTLGDSTKWARDIDDYSELQSYFSTNVYSSLILNNVWLKFVGSVAKKFVVNITSKAAIAPIKSFAFYCAGKAAREMFFRVLAEESKDVLVLNYSPGPVETDMTVDAQKNSVAEETSEMFKNLRSSGTILTTDQTTNRFLEVIAKGNYQSGDHVDYYDEH